MKLIYICSPCRGHDGNYEHNIAMAQEYCRDVMTQFTGLLPIAPHVYFTQFMDDTDPRERSAGIAAGLELMLQCSEVWVFGIQNPSEGMAREIKFARENNIKVVDAVEMFGRLSPAAAYADNSAAAPAAIPASEPPDIVGDVLRSAT